MNYNKNKKVQTIKALSSSFIVDIFLALGIALAQIQVGVGRRDGNSFVDFLFLFYFIIQS